MTCTYVVTKIFNLKDQKSINSLSCNDVKREVDDLSDDDHIYDSNHLAPRLSEKHKKMLKDFRIASTLLGKYYDRIFREYPNDVLRIFITQEFLAYRDKVGWRFVIFQFGHLTKHFLSFSYDLIDDLEFEIGSGMIHEFSCDSVQYLISPSMLDWDFKNVEFFAQSGIESSSRSPSIIEQAQSCSSSLSNTLNKTFVKEDFVEWLCRVVLTTLGLAFLYRLIFRKVESISKYDAQSGYEVLSCDAYNFIDDQDLLAIFLLYYHFDLSNGLFDDSSSISLADSFELSDEEFSIASYEEVLEGLPHIIEDYMSSDSSIEIFLPQSGIEESINEELLPEQEMISQHNQNQKDLSPSDEPSSTPDQLKLGCFQTSNADAVRDLNNRFVNSGTPIGNSGFPASVQGPQLQTKPSPKSSAGYQQKSLSQAHMDQQIQIWKNWGYNN